MGKREVKENSYTVIHAWMVNELGLSGTELLLYAVIYGFSQDGESWYCGSKKYLCDWCGASDTTIWRCLKSLKSKGLIESRERKINGIQMFDYRCVIKQETQDVAYFKMKDPISKLNTPFQNKIPYKQYIEIKDIEDTDNEPKEKTETELKRARENPHGEPKDEGTIRMEKALEMFEMIWDRISWKEKHRFNQTKEVQWGYCASTLSTISAYIGKDELMGRIDTMTNGTWRLGKTLSYFLQDNIDVFVAKDEDTVNWSKL